jgi:putative phosphoserine phosphatase/1-acylglycerol-3-phosphate O-acyltransferase
MSVHGEVTREIDQGPSGPRIGAFFDLDGTLVAVFSAIEFVRDAVLGGRMSAADFAQAVATATRFQLGQIGFSAFVAGTSGALAGGREDEFREIGERLFRDRLAAAIYPESRALVEAHQRRGHTVCVVSAATPYQVEPLARDMDIEHILCTRLEVKDGVFTGAVLRPTVYGEGKASAVRRFARARKVRVRESYFYTDSDEDLPLLDLVGKPRPTNPNRRLAEIAVKRGWPQRRFHSRGTPGVTEILRTSLAVGSLLPSFLLGLPAALLDRSARRMVNVATATWGELGTALAGLDLHVEGEEHLWSQRPAVFVFNHQSGIDFLLLCKMLRRDIVGVAKQELRSNPLFGPVFSLAGTVFIDRFNREKAIEAMQPAVDALRRGLSIVIAPEGTRSPTPRLGRFKKGAFHLAMAAKAPIVPIVFRNALDALPKNGYVVRPATIEAVVLPPISTATWKASELDQHVEEVRDLFERELRR